MRSQQQRLTAVSQPLGNDARETSDREKRWKHGLLYTGRDGPGATRGLPQGEYFCASMASVETMGNPAA